MSRCFVFDLDGTVTTEEILPIFAAELSLEEELTLLTSLTLSGAIPFEQSFRLRYALLKHVHPERLRHLAANVSINMHIANFIQKNYDCCYIATGNLDVWIKPLIEKLGCKAFYSIAEEDETGRLSNLQILRKNEAILSLRQIHDEVIVVGESMNDLPMFEAADVGIAFGGVHQPVHEVIQVSNYVCYEGSTLCRLLSTL